MTPNEQKFREFCDLIHAAHPEMKSFFYWAQDKDISVRGYPRPGPCPDFGVWPCPDFGPDDLEYTIKPTHVWKVPDETTPQNTWVWYLTPGGWEPGCLDYVNANGAIVFDHGRNSFTAENIATTTYRICVLADPENPERKPDYNWRPE